MRYIASAFSLSMLPSNVEYIRRRVLVLEDAVLWYHHGRQPSPCVGHEDTANVMAGLLETNDNLFRRMSVNLEPGDEVLIFQIISGRLQAGATELPAEFEYRWELVSLPDPEMMSEVLQYGTGHVSPHLATKVRQLF